MKSTVYVPGILYTCAAFAHSKPLGQSPVDTHDENGPSCVPSPYGMRLVPGELKFTLFRAMKKSTVPGATTVVGLAVRHPPVWPNVSWQWVSADATPAAASAHANATTVAAENVAHARLRNLKCSTTHPLDI
jgi:hypothetical protein